MAPAAAGARRLILLQRSFILHAESNAACQKMANGGADLRRVRFQREVAGFVKADFRIRNVTSCARISR